MRLGLCVSESLGCSSGVQGSRDCVCGVGSGVAVALWGFMEPCNPSVNLMSASGLPGRRTSTCASGVLLGSPLLLFLGRMGRWGQTLTKACQPFMLHNVSHLLLSCSLAVHLFHS